MGRGRKTKTRKMIQKDNQRAKKARAKKKADAVRASRKRR